MYLWDNSKELSIYTCLIVISIGTASHDQPRQKVWLVLDNHQNHIGQFDVTYDWQKSVANLPVTTFISGGHVVYKEW